MELDKIKRLKEQVGRMEDTPKNLAEAIGALCSIVEELIMAVNSAQRELMIWTIIGWSKTKGMHNNSIQADTARCEQKE